MDNKFTLEYDAITGILMVEALREKAEADILEAEADEESAFNNPEEMSEFYDLKALQARNRARVLQEAADDIRKTVHNALVSDFNKAFKRRGR